MVGVGGAWREEEVDGAWREEEVGGAGCDCVGVLYAERMWCLL